jgi:hypothetical protein
MENVFEVSYCSLVVSNYGSARKHIFKRNQLRDIISNKVANELV